MKNKSYDQFCALAYALDVIGERWTLLVIRELLTGPRRYKDLVAGLPGISTNLLSDRLKSLEQQGVLCRRVLPPPAGCSVYELTPIGQALEKSMLELGRWGSRWWPPAFDEDAVPSVGSIALALKAFFRPELARRVKETYELHLGEEVLQVRIQQGALQVRQGAAWKPDVIFHTEMKVFLRLFTGQVKPDEAISRGLVQVEGDRGALSRFQSLCALPKST
jgi:DNA-binding HxlR family transcriptional regulator/putative sterol carrier protein